MMRHADEAQTNTQNNDHWVPAGIPVGAIGLVLGEILHGVAVGEGGEMTASLCRNAFYYSI